MRLGASLLALVASGLAFAAGCEVYGGKLYPAGKAPGYKLEESCESADVDSTPSVRIEVATEKLVPLPRAGVHLRRHDLGVNLDYVSNEKGVAEASVPAGSWEVDVKLDGFRPAHYVLELPPGKACTLKFRLSIDNSAGFFL